MPPDSLGGLRILISAGPMFGHLNAVLPTAQAAVRAGAEVVVATGAEMVDRVRDHGVDAVPVGPPLRELRTEHGENWLALFIDGARRRAPDLVALAREWQPDVVMHEETELGGAVAAAVSGARHIVHGLGVPAPPRIWETLASGLDEVGRRWGAPDMSRRLVEATYLDLCPPALQPTYGSLCSRVQPLRPSVVSARTPERLPMSIESLPYDRTVHLTLGTVFNHRTPVLDLAISALRELAVNVVVTTGPGSDPRRFGPQPPHVVVEPYLPHSALLPRCALVVSQGGAGVMFGALAHGLPHLMLPQGADQFGNAEVCARAGVAIALTNELVNEDSITDAARLLLDDHRYTAAATAVRAEIEDMPSAADALAAVVQGAERRRRAASG